MADMVFRESDVRREHTGRFAAQERSAPEPGLLASTGLHRLVAKQKLDHATEVRGKLSADDVRALDTLPAGSATSFTQFQRTAFPGLFTRRKAAKAMSRLVEARAVDVYDYSTTSSEERLEIVRII